MLVHPRCSAALSSTALGSALTRLSRLPATNSRIVMSQWPIVKLQDRRPQSTNSRGSFRRTLERPPRHMKPSQSTSHVFTQRRFQSSDSAETTPARDAAGFSYRVAAAYSGKRKRFDPTKHYFSFDSTTSKRHRAGKRVDANIPQTGSLLSGQDAVFVTKVGDTESVAFGVADGVGGWEEQGIDSASFAHGLCMYMEEVAKYHKDGTHLGPQKLLKTAYDRVCTDKSIEGGGSTACLAIVDRQGTASVANLGDSGFMQLRLNKVHYYSDPQTHAFNTPYQLSLIPPKILTQIEVFGGGAPFSDVPDDANVTTHSLRHGDVLVFATDGVWDNLSSQDVLEIVSDRMMDHHAWEDRGDGTQVNDSLVELTQDSVETASSKALHSALATDLVQSAKDAGMDRHRDGPFAKAFQRRFPMERFSGGKNDDIAVVVAIVIDSAFKPASHASGPVKSKL